MLDGFLFGLGFCAACIAVALLWSGLCLWLESWRREDVRDWCIAIALAAIVVVIVGGWQL